MNYKEQLRDPRWQRLSAQCKEKAKYQCRICGRNEGPIQLQCHHKFYNHGAKVWEYQVGDLMCLCDDCHRQTTEALHRLRVLFGDLAYWHTKSFVSSCEQLKSSYSLRTIIECMQLVAENPQAIPAIQEVLNAK